MAYISDTLRSIKGCDSIITNVELTVDTSKTMNINATICAGSFYTLPSGKQVKTAGIYIDTLKSTIDCDSIITILNLTLTTPINVNIDTLICNGSYYTLPSGKQENATGSYIDTLKSVAGCDSIITTLNLMVSILKTANISATICMGSYYTLPSGKQLDSAGVYADTIRNRMGCDSMITTSSFKF